MRSEPAVASALGIGSLWLKDETCRLGVGSFKALGGAYVVDKLSAGSSAAQQFATASAGNHGIGLAWGCRRKGHECHVFMAVLSILLKEGAEGGAGGVSSPLEELFKIEY